MPASETEPAGNPEAVSQDGAPRSSALSWRAGQSRRLGGTDKSLLVLAGPADDRPRPRTAGGSGAGGRDQRRRRECTASPTSGAPIAPDPIGGFAGPAGGHSRRNALGAGALPAGEVHRNHAGRRSLSCRLISFAVSRPRLAAAPISQSPRPAAACTIPPGYGPSLSPTTSSAWLADSRHRAVHRWVEERGFRPVGFDGEPDPFLNVNTPADVALAESWLARGAAA